MRPTGIEQPFTDVPRVARLGLGDVLSARDDFETRDAALHRCHDICSRSRRKRVSQLLSQPDEDLRAVRVFGQLFDKRTTPALSGFRISAHE